METRKPLTQRVGLTLDRRLQRRQRDVELPKRVEVPESTRVPVIDPDGLIRFNAGEIQFTRGEHENVITATDKVVVE